jgi:gliding motility-associated-like protein
MKKVIPALVLLFVLLTSGELFAQAPTISYGSPQTYVAGTAITALTPTSTGVASQGYGSGPVGLGSGFISPWTVAVDAGGNVYVADAGNNSVKKIPAGGGTPVAIGSGFVFPTGVALDAAGNVYVADRDNGAIKKIPSGGGATVTLGTGFLDPGGITLDAAGNIYVADNGDAVIKEIPINGASIISLGSGFNSPWGVTVDPLGNVYVADQANNAVKKIPAGGGTPVNIGSGFSSPYGVALDAAGNLFVADGGNSAIKVIFAGSNTPVTIGSGFYGPTGVAVDGAGNVYVADEGNNLVKEIKPVGGYYLSNALPGGLNFNSATGVITGTPLGANPATNYSVTAYNSSGSGAATVSIQVNPFSIPTISYASPQTYTQGTAITALTPTSSGVAAPGYSNALVTIGSGFNNPAGVAADAAGNVYVADLGNNAIKKIPVGGGAPVIVSSAFNGPSGVAVDAAGNVYVADSGDNTVYKIPVGTTVPVVLASAANFSALISIAIDAAGNVYVTDSSTIKLIPAGGGALVTIGSGFVRPTGVAVDAAGNVYVADNNQGKVFEILITGGAPVLIGSGYVAPTGVAVDVEGDVYVADQGNNSVTEISVGGGAQVILNSGFNDPFDLAVDASGNVYVADKNNNAVKEIKPVGGYYIGTSLPAGLIFNGATGVISGTPGVVSAATNYTIVAYNGSGGSKSATVSIKVNAPPIPVISYSSPQTYILGTAISPLSPVSSGVAIPGYNSIPVAIGTGFNQPGGVAVDAAGNVYVAEYGSNAVKKIPAGGGSPVAIGSGFNQPTDVAVDALGNVYVADQGNNAVKKIPVGGGAPVILQAGVSHPDGVAVDAAGNVYVVYENTGAVTEIPANGSANVSIGSGLRNPFGVAVDASGNIYVGDNGTNLVTKIVIVGGAQVAIGSGFNNPDDLAVDAAGNVYVADQLNNAVKMIPASGGSPVTIGSGFNNPVGAAIDGNGNIYVGDFGNGAVKEINPAGGYYITPFLPLGLNFNTTTGVISGTPAVASTAANYTVTAYNTGGGSATTVNITVNAVSVPTISYSSPQTYTQGTAITALTPTSSGVAVPGYGSSPVKLGSGFIEPGGVAADAAGNIYVADYGNNAVKKIPAGGGAPITLGSGFSTPTGVAVDATGNVYVADYGNHAVKKIPVGGGAPVTIGSGFNNPAGIAIDAAGDIYVGDSNGNSSTPGLVKMIPAGSNVPVSIGSGFHSPFGVAVDASGNVYVADADKTVIIMIPANGGAQVSLGSGFNNVLGVAVDAAGNIFVADLGNNAIKEIPAGNGAVVTLGSGFNQPSGVGLDGAGNLDVGDFGNNAVKQIKPVGGYYLSSFLPTGLNFNTTTGVISGTPTVASPATNYTVTAYNAEGSGTATVNIKVSLNATLSKLTISSGTLTPVFAAATTTYTDKVANTVTSIAFRATTTDPTATETINGTAVPEGTVSPYVPLNVGLNTITIIVTAADGVTKDTYTVAVTRASSIATLSGLTISSGTLTPAFAAATTSYTDKVVNTVTSIAFRATTTDPTATETINGTAVPEGTVSPYVPLNVGLNTITIIVTAADGVTKDTYTVAVTRASSVATLSGLTISSGTLTPVFAAATTSYTDKVVNTVTSIAFRATTTDPTATETINGTAVPEGTVSPYVPLNVGLNTITIIVTAADGVTKDTYTVAVTRASSIATLSGLTISSGTLTPAFAAATTSYTDKVVNTVTSIAFRATTTDPTATETINGTAVPEGTVSPYFPVNVGLNTITIIVTAADGVTKDTYTVAVTRAAPPQASTVYESLSVEPPAESPQLADDGIMIHKGISPNGDGIDDFLQIDNITNYPDNRLAIMNRNGILVYEAKGYDNASRVFDGHSNKNGAMQLPGTYFYSLDYIVNGIIRYKTGFLVLKY